MNFSSVVDNVGSVWSIARSAGKRTPGPTPLVWSGGQRPNINQHPTKADTDTAATGMVSKGSDCSRRTVAIGPRAQILLSIRTAWGPEPVWAAAGQVFPRAEYPADWDRDVAIATGACPDETTAETPRPPGNRPVGSAGGGQGTALIVPAVVSGLCVFQTEFV